MYGRTELKPGKSQLQRHHCPSFWWQVSFQAPLSCSLPLSLSFCSPRPMSQRRYHAHSLRGQADARLRAGGSSEPPESPQPAGLTPVQFSRCQKWTRSSFCSAKSGPGPVFTSPMVDPVQFSLSQKWTRPVLVQPKVDLVRVEFCGTSTYRSLFQIMIDLLSYVFIVLLQLDKPMAAIYMPVYSHWHMQWLFTPGSVLLVLFENYHPPCVNSGVLPLSVITLA